ncbi:hypothetical protein [Aeromicrobium sp. CTD01-1L150]|uniref:hypothetical protein n=1 Tax=Aeromicrobium sp. CTD01-1L150 TaxID=3341830 RepID=UPI0035C1CDA0
MSLTRKFAASAAVATIASLGLGVSAATAVDDVNGPSSRSSLANVSENNVGPFQVCNNTVPVNVLGVQVPFDQIAGVIGLVENDGNASSNAKNCDQESAQDN